jgi:hypothetical protein
MDYLSILSAILIPSGFLPVGMGGFTPTISDNNYPITTQAGSQAQWMGDKVFSNKVVLGECGQLYRPHSPHLSTIGYIEKAGLPTEDRF